ncbi:MAG: helix-turn-helix domain-containing protein, partial [Bacteroidia bacterium]|nr:helix-turn-helix domain-containing protein [Bacteroidia bacterium]
MKQKRYKNLWEEKSARIASKIRDTLGSMNIAQTELAKSLNVSRQHVNKILKGKE